MVTKDYYNLSSHVFPSLCLSFDIFAVSSPKNSCLRLVFHLKMASAYIPFDEGLDYCTTHIPGEVFFLIFSIKVKKIFETTMRARVRMIFIRKTTSLQAILGIRMLRAIATDFTNQFLLRMLHPYFSIPPIEADEERVKF